MATKLNEALISEFEKNLRTESEKFRSIEKEMDNLLNHAILWNDPIAQRFRARYVACMNPLHTKLLPAMENYQNFLRKVGEKIRIASQSED